MTRADERAAAHVAALAVGGFGGPGAAARPEYGALNSRGRLVGEAPRFASAHLLLAVGHGPTIGRHAMSA